MPYMLCKHLFSSFQKVGYIKHLCPPSGNFSYTRTYLDKLKIKKSYYFVFEPKIEKCT